MKVPPAIGGTIHSEKLSGNEVRSGPVRGPQERKGHLHDQLQPIRPIERQERHQAHSGTDTETRPDRRENCAPEPERAAASLSRVSSPTDSPASNRTTVIRPTPAAFARSCVDQPSAARAIFDCVPFMVRRFISQRGLTQPHHL